MYVEVVFHAATSHRRKAWTLVRVSYLLWCVEYMATPVFPLVVGLYGIMRCGLT